MKKYFFKILSIAFITSIFCVSCKAQKEFNGYTITGNVKGIDDGWVKLMNAPVFFTDSIVVIDSTQMKNGKFKFKGRVDNVDMVLLKLSSKFNSYFFLENSKINLEINASNAEESNGYIAPKITGSKTQDLYELQKQKIDSIKSQEKYSAFKGYREQVIAAKRSKDSVLQEQIKQRMTALEPLEKMQGEEIKNFKVNFVKNNPSSPVGPSLMGISFSEIVMSREEMKTVYNMFMGDAKKASRFRLLKKSYEDYVEKFVAGATVPDFTLKTMSGDNLTLSKVKANYILVDFWASWCIPCRASFPKLKKVYKTYKNSGFEVVAVATGDKDKNWRDAIQKDQTPWLHVFDVNEKSVGRNGDVANAYGVPFLPTTYLLDSDLKIILRNPTKEELDSKLKELLGH